jgi:hypothetical protein
MFCVRNQLISAPPHLLHQTNAGVTEASAPPFNQWRSPVLFVIPNLHNLVSASLFEILHVLHSENLKVWWDELIYGLSTSFYVCTAFVGLRRASDLFQVPPRLRFFLISHSQSSYYAASLLQEYHPAGYLMEWLQGHFIKTTLRLISILARKSQESRLLFQICSFSFFLSLYNLSEYFSLSGFMNVGATSIHFILGMLLCVSIPSEISIILEKNCWIMLCRYAHQNS